MKKRYFIVILAIIFLIMLRINVIADINDVNDITAIFIPSNNELIKGEEFTVSLYIDCEQGINGGSITINYDEENIEFIPDKTIFDPQFINLGQGLKFDFLCNSSNSVKQANIMTFAFKVKETSRSADTIIKATNIIIDTDQKENHEKALQDIETKFYINSNTNNTNTTDSSNTTESPSAEDSSDKMNCAKTISLSKTSYTYNGKVQKPTVTAKDKNGKVISSSNYTVTYSNKSSKKVGKYKVTVKFKGDYSGTKELTYTIKPKGVSIKKLTSGKKQFTVSYNKNTTETSGYEIQYATDKNFTKNNKKVKIKSNKTISKKITNLKAKKKYYIRVRTYKNVKYNGKSITISSGWSKIKNITTKK